MVFLKESVEASNKASYLLWHSYESIDWKNYATVFSWKNKTFFLLSEIEVYV